MSAVAILQETLPFDFEAGTSLYSEEDRLAGQELPEPLGRRIRLWPLGGAARHLRGTPGSRTAVGPVDPPQTSARSGSNAQCAD